MIKKLNKFLYSSIVISVLMCFLGLVFMIYPQMSFETINYVLAIILIVNGIYFMLENENNILFSGLQSIGIVELLINNAFANNKSKLLSSSLLYILA